MLLVADVHGANRALARVARSGEPLLVLGDLLDLFDYRTGEGLMVELVGRDLVLEFLRLREHGEAVAARAAWQAFEEEHAEEVAAGFGRLARAGYAEVAEALAGTEAYVTFGNADQPELLRRSLPPGVHFVDGEVVEIEGLRVGFVGGGLTYPGRVREEDLAAKLAGLGEVDVLCTHVAPAVDPLGRDVISGRCKHSPAVLDYLLAHRPRWHYFGDVHQPQALSWRVGETLCRNVGHFRATGRAVHHG
jgi:Icc-related predicted phosphoesterase